MWAFLSYDRKYRENCKKKTKTTTTSIGRLLVSISIVLILRIPTSVQSRANKYAHTLDVPIVCLIATQQTVPVIIVGIPEGISFGPGIFD